jgi:hypothetical protein
MHSKCARYSVGAAGFTPVKVTATSTR